MINGLIPPECPEHKIVPYTVALPPGRRVIVLAPHPDDESLGCGGSLSLLSKAGSDIKVVFLTKGEKAVVDTDRERYAILREKEAERAMEILGVVDYDFLRFPDRELYSNIDKAKGMLSGIIGRFRPDTLYSPSPIELHPDHRTSALLALDILRTYGIRVVYYELITPIRPNLLVDVSSVFRIKRKAVRSYKSQLKITDYLKLMSSLNTFRTFTLGRDVKYAEAFWSLEDKSDAEKLGLWLGFRSLYEVSV